MDYYKKYLKYKKKYLNIKNYGGAPLKPSKIQNEIDSELRLKKYEEELSELFFPTKDILKGVYTRLILLSRQNDKNSDENKEKLSLLQDFINGNKDFLDENIKKFLNEDDIIDFKIYEQNKVLEQKKKNKLEIIEENTQLPTIPIIIKRNEDTMKLLDCGPDMNLTNCETLIQKKDNKCFCINDDELLNKLKIIYTELLRYYNSKRDGHTSSKQYTQNEIEELERNIRMVKILKYKIPKNYELKKYFSLLKKYLNESFEIDQSVFQKNMDLIVLNKKNRSLLEENGCMITDKLLNCNGKIIKNENNCICQEEY
jgi:hypothetical protein